jgi:hypothetical protein
MSGLKRFFVFLLLLGIAAAFLQGCPAFKGNNQLVSRTSSPFRTDSSTETKVGPLTTAIQAGTEWFVVDVVGPPDNTWAKFQLVGSTTQVIGKCQEAELARPEEGFDKMHYFASENNSRVLTPSNSAFQTFYVSEEVTQSFQPTQIFPSATATVVTFTATSQVFPETVVPTNPNIGLLPETEGNQISFTWRQSLLWLVIFTTIIVLAIGAVWYKNRGN